MRCCARHSWAAGLLTVVLVLPVAASAAVRIGRGTDVLITVSSDPEHGKGLDAKSRRELRESVDDLARHLSDICGAKARVGAGKAAAGGVTIHVGRTPFVEGLGLDLTKLDREGFAIRIAGRDVVLAGRTALGSRHAVHTFLERFCGVRWYFPGPLGTVVPKRDAIMLAETDVREEPAFRARYFTVHPDADVRQWERRNKLQDHWNVRLKGNSHSMAGILPTKSYGVAHPEFYALRKGARQVPQSRARERRAAYCLTNPGVADACAQWVTRYFETHPRAESVSMAMNDTSAYCQCARCRAQGVRGAVDGPNYSDRYFSFVNEVARRVRPKYPDRTVGVLAYGGASELPNRL